jgi:hypothetical protein
MTPADKVEPGFWPSPESLLGRAHGWRCLGFGVAEHYPLDLVRAAKEQETAPAVA